MKTRKMLRAKIHRATVTHADINYEGSVTIPPDLMEAADLYEFEAVNIWNVSNGNRLETYAIRGEEGSSAICINGAAARLAGPGDLVIIAAFSDIPESECGAFKPRVVFVDCHNRITDAGPEIAGPGVAPVRSNVYACS